MAQRTMNKRKQEPWKLYTACAWCGSKMDCSDKRMTCRDCPKRPQPTDRYTEDLMRVSVYPPSNGNGVDFAVTNEFIFDMFRGTRL